MKPATMRLVFLAAALLVALAWAAFYLYFMRLHCAASAADGACAIILPWQLRGGPFYLLTGLPASIIVTLLALGWLTGRDPGDQNRRS